MGPNTHRSRSISDVSSFSTESALSFDLIRVRAQCVEEPQPGYILALPLWWSHTNRFFVGNRIVRCPGIYTGLFV